MWAFFTKHVFFQGENMCVHGAFASKPAVWFSIVNLCWHYLSHIVICWSEDMCVCVHEQLRSGIYMCPICHSVSAMCVCVCARMVCLQVKSENNLQKELVCLNILAYRGQMVAKHNLAKVPDDSKWDSQRSAAARRSNNWRFDIAIPNCKGWRFHWACSKQDIAGVVCTRKMLVEVIPRDFSFKTCCCRMVHMTSYLEHGPPSSPQNSNRM